MRLEKHRPSYVPGTLYCYKARTRRQPIDLMPVTCTFVDLTGFDGEKLQCVLKKGTRSPKLPAGPELYCWCDKISTLGDKRLGEEMFTARILSCGGVECLGTPLPRLINDACYDRGITFWRFVSESRGSSTPNRKKFSFHFEPFFCKPRPCLFTSCLGFRFTQKRVFG